MQRIVALIMIVILWNFIAWAYMGIDIPIPSSYIAVMIMFNAMLAFFSIFIQRWVIVLFEVNVFEEPETIGDYLFKYIAIMTSGINYYIQIIFRRLPFILNKLAALAFFLFLILIWFMLTFIFS